MNRKHVSLLVSLMFLTGVGTAQQATTIKIRFANGRNGKPLHLKSYERGYNEASSKYEVGRIEGDTMLVTFKDVSSFTFRANYFEPCDANGPDAKAPSYNLQQIVAHGVVAPNVCGHTHATPKAGELLIYSRHEHWWRVTGDVVRGLLICA